LSQKDRSNNIPPLTKKGMKTRKKLIDTAEEIFGTKGFFNTSIVDITQKAGVAQGTYYLYFSSKEEIFQEILKELVNDYFNKLQREMAGVSNPKEELAVKYRFYFCWVKKRPNLNRLINQTMLVNKELYRWFLEATVSHHYEGLHEGIESGEFRDLDVNTMAHCITGIYAFIGWRWGYLEDKQAPDDVVKDVLTFVFGGLEQREGKNNNSAFVSPEIPKSQIQLPVTNDTVKQPLTPKGIKTHKNLLEAAEETYASKGYFNTSIVEITQKAGVAQGTFYVHFSSKQEIFEELIKKLSRDFATELYKETVKADNIKEELVIRIRFLFRWMKIHRNLFSLVEQAILVNEDLYRRFYENAISSYEKVLKAGMKTGEFKHLDTETMAYSLIGLTGLVGSRWIYLEDKEVPDYILDDVFKLIFHGLEQINERG